MGGAQWVSLPGVCSGVVGGARGPPCLVSTLELWVAEGREGHSRQKELHTLDSEARRSKVTLVKRDEGGRKGSLELDAVNFALILGAADSPYRVFQG